eukprot:TRINITY_DN487_c0_g1_i1.p1 TRINITY_DN487_c0_g1~~TRINITY_DN487_c0_g1_i1.p1  ORF type:complete len:629 (-),score=93.69 TRINITY_DN487_c0_g1_i1:431-2317(-)
MPSDAKKKRAASKKAKAQAKLSSKTDERDPKAIEEEEGASSSNAAALAQQEGEDSVNGVDTEIEAGLLQMKEEIQQSNLACTGVLESHQLSRDVHVINFTLLFHGHQLLEDTKLELNHGRRYGLLGPNGCGKSTLLKAIAARDIPIPEHIDIYFLDRECAASDKTALEVVKSVDAEKIRLEKEADALADMEMTDEVEQQLTDIYERLDLMESATSEARAASILHGLGFTKEMQNRKTSDFSGGWRMRIALARALFVQPTMLLLDEPTNHLDLEACVWLEDYLMKFNRILLVISHSQDFLNGVCTNIIHMHQKKLKYYSGNYDTYVSTRAQLEEEQMKRYKWEQNEIAQMKEFIAKFGHGSAKLARQAQSREKLMKKMIDAGLTEKVVSDRTVTIKFDDVGKLPPPVLQFSDVTFGYSSDKVLYRNVDLGVDLDSRVALVGPNGAGKSTLLKLMIGTLEPLDGQVKRHNHLKICMYHQHLTELLDPAKTPLEYMMSEFTDVPLEKMRSQVGRFGISGRNQTLPIGQLSDGFKSRVVFSWLAYQRPHMLLLDEPTNHLDIETIDSLAEGINNWDGGLVLVSHDFRLIGQVAKEIWEVNKGTVTVWKDDIIAYKNHLRKTHAALAKREDLA